MATLYATRGLQGCGKSRRARAWVDEDPTHRAMIERDMLRRMVHNGFWDGDNTEKLIKRMRNTLITTALKMGNDVVSSDTNLDNRTIRDLRDLACKNDADFVVWDMTDVPVEICIERDAHRVWPEFIGEKVIRKAYEKYVKGRPYPLPIIEPTAKELAAANFAPYVPPTDATLDAVIVDIDGTLCHMAGRSPYDESRVHEDTPNHAVIEVIDRLAATGMKIIFCSGRTDKCKEPTREWILKNTPLSEDDFVLFMRRHDDKRKDSIVKREIFERHLRNMNVRIICVLDDRQQVVDMWRDELGLTCLQVAPGDF